MAQRDIAGLPGIDRQGNPHQLCPHFVQTGGFGIDRDMPDIADMVDPPLQRVQSVHALIGAVIKGFALGGRGGVVLGGIAAAKARSFGHGRGLDLQLFGHAPGKGAELHLLQEAQQLFRLRLMHLKAVEAEIQRHLCVQRHQTLGHTDQISIVLQRLAPLGLLDLGRT